MMNPFSESTLPRLTGVVDLKASQCVHAIKGDRANYQPLRWPSRDGDREIGTPQRLVEHYHQLGLRSIYIADLDSLGGKPVQFQAMEEALSPFEDLESILMDPGLRGIDLMDQLDVSRVCDAIQLANRFSKSTIVLASESVRDLRAFEVLAERIGPERVALGLDYHAERFRTVDTDTRESDWLAAAQRIGIRQIVIIDTYRVGTSGGPTLGEICRRISEAFPDFCITAGGGIRNTEDVETLRCCGCDRFLVATALLPPHPG
ncbi:1-(5-phosphoribosyl)-5-[(5-phosphoribosylamino)methylideneamino] imidazole-4-carboxamide isomerase [Novipirellula aureliae]|uniref:1-(5-phosphoribosyl)-5-[(5-phosphoribosylamino)methylideneamino] imidazole-4-carboxamide isomerase n=2 Tax=Novipirellula aureliae TaxID=2527966 RepID=A0A5C6DGW9_9BACT|nr:1-(5-phosphoribosyl)-5-[(5-phosphoribosylamino)methylideneamino] imidazole-4-carboxamide isomerase [Novipirellula aureliae]